MVHGANQIKRKPNFFVLIFQKSSSPTNQLATVPSQKQLKILLLQLFHFILPPKPFSPAEVLHFINTFLLKKTPGIDLITAEVARQLPKTALIHLTHILNSILRLSYFPIQWKISLIILIPKPGKPPDTPSSYRPISLLPFFVKLCEKMILKRISKIINEN